MGVIIEYALRLVFKATNHMAKHKALAKGLDLIKGIKFKKLNTYNDS